MEYQHDHGDDAPAAVQSRQIKTDLFRLVPRPDDQELRKIEVGPEHHKGKEQFAEVVQMALLQHARERLSARKKHDDRNHEGHRGNELSRDEQEAVDGGRPVGRKRHDPVDGREAHHENVKNDARAGEHLEAKAQSAVFGLGVLLLGQNIEDEHEQQPDCKINDRANVKTV